MSSSQKRFTFIILGAFAALLVFASLSGCASLQSRFEQPTVKLAGISLLEAGLIQQVFAVSLQVDNPNGFSLPIKAVDYAVKLGGQDFASGLTPNAFSIPANGSDQINLEIRTNLLETYGYLRTLLSNKPQNLDYQLSGNIQVNLPLMNAIPFSQSGTIPLTRQVNAEAL